MQKWRGGGGKDFQVVQEVSVNCQSCLFWDYRLGLYFLSSLTREGIVETGQKREVVRILRILEVIAVVEVVLNGLEKADLWPQLSLN